MKFVRVDDEVVSVELSLDALNSIASALESDNLGERQVALGKGFRTAHSRFTEPEVTEETEEVTE